MRYGRFDQQGRVFFGRVEGDSVVQKDIGVLRNPVARAGA